MFNGRHAALAPPLAGAIGFCVGPLGGTGRRKGLDGFAWEQLRIREIALTMISCAKLLVMAQEERLRTHEYTFTAVFEAEPEGGYTIHFPALRGCITYGETLDEARDMAREALELYLESLCDSPAQPLQEPIRVQLKLA
jgi:predicted RNase H-like HicB family nuclease